MNESPEDSACLYVLDQLDPGERAAFEAHLLREPKLAALVRDLESGLARGVRALPRHEPPAGALDRIEGRIDALRALATLPEPASRPFPWVAFARWGLAAMIAVSLATLAVQSLRSSAGRPMIVFVGLDPNRSTFAELPLREPGQDPDARFIQLASLAQNFWEKPGDLPVKPNPVPGDNRGYALFDPGSRQGFIAIEQLPLIAETQRYHLWIRDPSTARVHDAGILPLGGMNRGLYSFALGPVDGPKNPRPNFFITVEDNDAASPPAQPRGKIVLGHQRL
jgi:hypothetical protein